MEELLHTYMNVFQVQQTQALHTGYKTFCSSSLHLDHVTPNGMQVVHLVAVAH